MENSDKYYKLQWTFYYNSSNLIIFVSIHYQSIVLSWFSDLFASIHFQRAKVKSESWSSDGGSSWTFEADVSNRIRHFAADVQRLAGKRRRSIRRSF
jgi:hypothetical protein